MHSRKAVTVESFNPYLPPSPQRKIVSRRLLHTIKLLRADGWTVEILPEDGSEIPLQYYVQKGGLYDAIHDPVVQFVVTTSVPFFATWLGVKLQKIHQRKLLRPAEIVLKEEHGVASKYYDGNGELIELEDLQLVFRNRDSKRDLFVDRAGDLSPYDHLPTPIFLEHTSRIIGWGRPRISPDRFEFEEAEITDDEIYEEIKAGNYRGFSIAGVVQRSACSTCGRDYAQCDHITGEIYDGQACSNEILGIRLLEVSLTRDPVNASALISILDQTK